MRILKNELLRLSWIYFALAFVNLRVKLLLTTAWYNGPLAATHERLIAFDFFNHEQSRLLQFWIPELFRQLFGLTIPDAYILQRWLFVFITFICFHLYLRK